MIRCDRRGGLRWASAVALVFLLGGVSPVAGDAARQSLVDGVGPAIVRVEAVLSNKVNMGGQGQEEESRVDLVGAVVDSGGLIMVWNSAISSGRMNELLAEMGRDEGFRMEITPIAFSVHVGGRERSAFLAATDSALDLAFIQLDESPQEPMAFVDFGSAVDPGLGDPILQVNRMGRSFDDAIHLETARIGGLLEKPRRAWIVDGVLEGVGLPVFTTEGQPVGVLTTIYSRVGDDAQGLSMGPMMGLFGGSSPFDSVQSFVLPGKRVASLVRLARDRASELAERRREAPAEGREESGEPEAEPRRR